MQVFIIRDQIFQRVPAIGAFAGVRFMEHFKLDLIEYLDYYSNHRIKAKRKGLPPAIHRQQALSAA